MVSKFKTLEDAEESRLKKTEMLAKIVSFSRRKKIKAKERPSKLAGGEAIEGKA